MAKLWIILNHKMVPNSPKKETNKMAYKIFFFAGYIERVIPRSEFSFGVKRCWDRVKAKKQIPPRKHLGLFYSNFFTMGGTL